MAQSVEEARHQARVMFDGAEFDRCHQTAVEALAAAPDDVELLVLAGRAGVELDAADAVEHLGRATELAPDEPGAWHHYGEALAAEGRMSEADAAFRRAVELDPDDQVALTHLGHTALAAGRSEEGVGYLSKAADIAHAGAGASTAMVSLVDMYRSFGQYEEALAQARRLADAVPDDVLARLDLAEMAVAAGHPDEAREAFERLRELDEVPGHEAYPLRGLIGVEIAQGNWERAQQLTDQAAAIDPYGLSTDVAAFVREHTGQRDAEELEQPPPTREEVDTALAASLAEYRRMLLDDRHLTAGELLG